MTWWQVSSSRNDLGRLEDPDHHLLWSWRERSSGRCRSYSRWNIWRSDGRWLGQIRMVNLLPLHVLSLVSKLLFPEVQAAPSIQAWRRKDHEQECLSSSSKQNCRWCLCRLPSVSDEMCRKLHPGERGRRNPAVELTQRRDSFRAIPSKWLGGKRAVTNAPGCLQSWACSWQSLWPRSCLIRHGRRSQSTFRHRGWDSQSSQRGDSILELSIKAILNLRLKGRGYCHRRCWRRYNRREHLQEELGPKEQRFSRDLGSPVFVASNTPWKSICKPDKFLTIDLGYFQGSLFVNFRATDFLKGSLSYSASRNFNI